MNRRSIVSLAVHSVLRDQFERKDQGGGGNANTNDRNESVRTVKSIADAETALREIQTQINTFVQKASGEMGESGRISRETAAAVTDLVTKQGQAVARLDALEAKYNRQGEGQEVQKSLGRIFIEDSSYTSMVSTKGKRARVEMKTLLGNMETRAVVNASGQNQPLVPDMRVPGIVVPTQRRLTIRDLIPAGRTSSNLVQYVKETLFTNNAGPQVSGSPTVAAENATKPESDLTFELANAPVITLAHFILASKQVLDDAPMLQSYIDGRLMYGLKLEEEDEILNGDGGAGTLSGLIFNAAAFNRAATGTRIDMLRRARTQVALQEMDLEGYVLNPVDWEEIELTKDTTGRYILARPESLAPPAIWGRPVIATNSITATYWLGGNFSQAAQLWDREDASVELSREDGDNFKKNMVTILAEERLALAVYRGAALVKGQFSG